MMFSAGRSGLSKFLPGVLICESAHHERRNRREPDWTGFSIPLTVGRGLYSYECRDG